MQAKIVTCVNVTFAKEELLSQMDMKHTKIFESEQFLIDDAKKVTKEAYIAESSSKYIMIVASSYRIEAQNALLKLLEEPPKNIIFILIAPSKTALLPTIRSRMQITHIQTEKEVLHLELDLKSMELVDIFAFLKAQKNISKETLKETIQVLLKSAVLEVDIPLYRKELELFDKALYLAELNTRAPQLLSTILLMLYHARGRKHA